MKEFSFKLQKEILNGLRESHVSSRNSGSLIDCMNILPMDQNLLAYEAATSLFDDEYLFDVIPPISWPFPQMYLGQTHSLLCFQTKIFSIDTSVSSWNVVKVYDFGSEPSWDEDNTWHFAPFYDMIVLSNGVKMLWYNPHNSTWEQITGTLTRPVMSTICAFNGQLVGGNFTSTYYDTDNTFLGWSKIGYYDHTIDESNVAGYAPMPFKEEVRKVMPFNNSIIVYGDSAIIAARPNGVNFEIKPLTKYGIMSRDAIFGNEDYQIFIDESGWLRQITPDFQIKRLGYQEFFSPMTDGYPVIINDSTEDRHYISDGTNNFILTQYGLGKGYQSIVSGEYIQGDFVGNIKRDDTPDEEYRIQTDIFDIGYRGQKTIESIDVGSDQATSCYVSIDYRYKATDGWSTTREVICNDEGVAHLRCAGLEFRFNLRFVDYEDVNLDYVNVKYKATDRRYVRGTTHATATTS